MLDISDIQLVKTIAMSGSINKAAEILFSSQSTISKRVSRLEYELKLELFYRDSTGMKPTKAAQYLIESGKNIERQVSALVRHLELLSDLEQGNLNVGLGPIVEQLLFPKVLIKFINNTKNINLSIKIEHEIELLSMVLNGELDIAIGPFDVDFLPKDMHVKLLYSEPIIFVSRTDHPLSKHKEELSLQTILESPIIGPAFSQAMLRNQHYHLKPEYINIECNNYRISKSVVTSSDYITGGAKELFKQELKEGKFTILPIKELLLWRSFVIIKPETIYHPTVKKFLEVLEKTINRKL